jgi:hypothetical protein
VRQLFLDADAGAARQRQGELLCKKEEAKRLEPTLLLAFGFQ